MYPKGDENLDIQEIRNTLQEEIELLSKGIKNCEPCDMADISKQLNESIRLLLSLY